MINKILKFGFVNQSKNKDLVFVPKKWAKHTNLKDSSGVSRVCGVIPKLIHRFWG